MNKKGFTLFEILAVIIILGIIGVIIYPKIVSTVSNSEKNTNKLSIEGLVSGLNSYALDKKTTLTPFDGCSYDFDSGISDCDDFSYSGELPRGGIIDVDRDGIVNGSVTFDGDKYFYIEKNEIVDGSLLEIVYDFDYINDFQTLTVEYSGYYKLEVWGAQGGNANSYRGGYGGHSTGIAYLKKGKMIYIYVGGQGESGYPNVERLGGFNGGGSVPDTNSDTNRYVAGGGGATHIGTIALELSALSNADSVLIVAGGGGGGYQHTASGYYGVGGDAGGYIGNDGSYGSSGGGAYGTGGSQEIGGYAYGTSSLYAGSFGLGGTVGTNTHGSAGGGGFYGGGASAGDIMNSGNSSGGGGSGYIGNSDLTNKSMFCYSCLESSLESTKTVSTSNVSEEAISEYAKMGNGYARITYLGFNLD